jgi:hypothetical protein
MSKDFLELLFEKANINRKIYTELNLKGFQAQQIVSALNLLKDCSAVYFVYYLHYTLHNTPSVTTV